MIGIRSFLASIQWNPRLGLVLGILVVLCGSVESVQAQEEIFLQPSHDNTLYEDGAGALSNGAGSHFFAGTTAASLVRRAVLSFDVSGIPAGSTIQSVELTLNMNRTRSGAESVALHRLTSDWGEGPSIALGQEGEGAPSEPDDATWLHSFFSGTLWSAPGGDFIASPSAVQSVDGFGPYTWSSTTLTSDVQSWVDDPSSAFGWILIGNEVATSTAKRFHSREGGAPPRLRVVYVAPAVIEVPTLSPGFMLALTLALVGLGFGSIRRRSSAH